MLFNSLHFLLFFPVVCILYFLIPARHTQWRNGLLLVASYYFYMNWEPIYALLLLGSTLTTFFAAIGIEKHHAYKRVYLTLSIILNLSILFIFKYYNFITASISELLTVCGIDMYLPSLHVLLPVGISFYIFQSLGYSIDVYRGDTPVEKNLLTYALFVSFFPQLVAGPIERSGRLLPQFKQPHDLQYINLKRGIEMMVWGYFVKLVIADRCGMYVDAVFNNIAQHNGGSYLLASLLFPFQIYGDFCGYSLIAIGTARILGFRLMENFHRPYLSSSVGGFWHRWHISLSTWFKDYVYIPLGGNRVGKFRTYVNLFVTFLVSGIWHGANWTFFLWGGIHGLTLCLEKALRIGKQQYTGFRKFAHWSVTFVIVCFAWIFFRANTITDAITVIWGIFTNFGTPFVNTIVFIALAIFLPILFIKEFVQEHHLFSTITRNSIFRLVSVVLLICLILLFGVLEGDKFIYFQF